MGLNPLPLCLSALSLQPEELDALISHHIRGIRPQSTGAY